MTEVRKKAIDPVTAALTAWIVPGAAHVLMGRYAKALLFFVLIVGTFLAGWAIGKCQDVYFAGGRWHTIVQGGAGLITFILGMGKPAADPQDTVRYYFEVGTLYTMVAGLLNLLVIMDAVMTSLRLRRG